MMRGEIPSRHRSPLSHRRGAKNPSLARKLEQMALRLAPLVQLTTGRIHPAFPTTVLNFWLLTDAELEALAAFYHQKNPSCWSNQYPCPITWSSDLPLEEKRRKMGKFIGLRGCDSPFPFLVPKTEEEIAQDARNARIAAEELQRKTW